MLGGLLGSDEDKLDKSTISNKIEMLFEQTMLQMESYQAKDICKSLIKTKIFNCYRKAMKVIDEVQDVISTN